MDNNVLDFNTLPDEVKQFLEIEDVSGFNEDRYFFSRHEKELFDTIIQADAVMDRFKEKGIRYLNSTLLYGGSGTGKTTLGRYVAYKLNLPFAYLSLAKITSGEFGGTSRNISSVFSHVNGKRCVLMLDEVDCISRKRAGTSEVQSSENTRVTITLMQELDKLKNDTIIIGATNILETIDPALKRRFTHKHEVKTLESDEMEQFIFRYLNDLEVEYEKGNIITYCKQHARHSQALIINDMNRCYARHLHTGQPFVLEDLKE